LGIVVLSAAPALASFAGPAPAASQRVSTAVLAPPTALAASNGPCKQNRSTSVALSWTPSPSGFATGYAIWRSDGPLLPFAMIGTASGASASDYLDTTVAFLGVYRYEVRALRNNWTSTASQDAVITTLSRTCH
jgi:hypothetical protein